MCLGICRKKNFIFQGLWSKNIQAFYTLSTQKVFNQCIRNTNLENHSPFYCPITQKVLKHVILSHTMACMELCVSKFRPLCPFTWQLHDLKICSEQGGSGLKFELNRYIYSPFTTQNFIHLAFN